MEQQNIQNKYKLGRVGWGLAIFAALVYLVSGPFWSGNAVNVIVPQMVIRFGFDSTARVLSVNTICVLVAAGLTIITQIIYTRVKNTRIVMVASYFLMALTVIILGFERRFAVYIIDYACLACLSMTIPMGGFNIMFDHYLPTKKGVALGWATAGGSFSGVLALPILTLLTNRFGLGIACLGFACYLIVFGILHWILWPADPKDKGYEPDNGDTPPEVLAAIERAKNDKPNWTMKEALTNRNFWIIAFAYGIFQMCATGGMQQLVVYQTMNGIDSSLATTAVIVATLVGFVGSAISGYIDTRFGVKTLGIMIGAFFFIAFLILGILPFSLVVIYVFAVIFGVFLGANSNAIPSHAIGVFGPDMPRVWRVILPIICALTGLSGVILGQMINLTGSYQRAYVIFGVLALVGMILLCFSQSSLMKEPGKPPVVVDRRSRSKAAAGNASGAQKPEGPVEQEIKDEIEKGEEKEE